MSDANLVPTIYLLKLFSFSFFFPLLSSDFTANKTQTPPLPPLSMFLRTFTFKVHARQPTTRFAFYVGILIEPLTEEMQADFLIVSKLLLNDNRKLGRDF